jgi:predicted outer membrane protein
MQKNNTLKGLLAVSAVAAMFSAVGVHAQTSLSSNPSQTGTSSAGQPNTSGKTTREGTIDNTNSTGMENRTKLMHGTGASGMAGQNAAGSSSGMSGQSSGSASSAGMAGQNATSSSSSMGASGAGQAAAGGAAATGAKLSASDQKAVKDMAMADMAEVETGKLALSKTQNSDVKAFAQQMVDDHGQALAKVQALAQARGVTLPTELDAKHKTMSAKLEKLSGDAFDKAYMANAGVKDHKDTKSKLTSAAKKIKDADVKALADQHMPVVEQHLKSAQQMNMAKSGTTAGK